MKKRGIVLRTFLLSIVVYLCCMTGMHASEYVTEHATDSSLCVLLHSTDTDVVQACVAGNNRFVHLLLSEQSLVDTAEKEIDASGHLGSRVIVELFLGDVLPYVDNLIDVVSLPADRLTNGLLKESLRVINPNGFVFVVGADAKIIQECSLIECVHIEEKEGGYCITKLPQTGVDEWPHWFHGPDNNAVSNDTNLLVHDRMQWLSGPHHAATPSMTVTAGGRVFTLTGGNAEHVREEETLHKLTARNAYNGIVLWQRDMPVGYVVYRSCMIAEKKVLYLLDYLRNGNTVLVLDAQTGEELQSIRVPELQDEIKWIAKVGDILYLADGEADVAATMSLKKTLIPGNPGGMQATIGWESRKEGKVYYGFSRNVAAYNTKTQTTLWVHTAESTIDTRTIAVNKKQLFYYSTAHSIASIDLVTGQSVWKHKEQSTLDLLETPIPKGEKIQTKANSLVTDSVYFILLSSKKSLAAFDTATGRLLWSADKKKGQFSKHLMSIDNLLYSQVPKTGFYNAQTGTFEKKAIGIVGCLRPTSASGFIYGRGSRYDMTTEKRTYDEYIRSDCWSGIIPSFGMLYWSAMACDCLHDFTGYLCRAPEKKPAAMKLSTVLAGTGTPAGLQSTVEDWISARQGITRTASSPVCIAKDNKTAHACTITRGGTLTQPIAVGSFFYVADSHGKVHCIDAQSKQTQWSFYASGAITQAPLFWKGIVYAACTDGFVYAVSAESGALVWKYRVAPAPFRMMLYGSLSSAWPVVGLTAHNDTIYVSAGILDRDGVRVAALNAETGALLWHNDTSGSTYKVSAMGNMIIAGGKLRMAGGLNVSPASYELIDGSFFPMTGQYNTKGKIVPYKVPITKGAEMGVFQKRYIVYGGKPLYSEKENAVYRGRFSFITMNDAGDAAKSEISLSNVSMAAPAWNDDIFVAHAVNKRGSTLYCWDTKALVSYLNQRPADIQDLTNKKKRTVQTTRNIKVDKVLYQQPYLRWNIADSKPAAIALAADSVLLLSEVQENTWEAQAVSPQDGSQLWSVSLPSAPVYGGLCINKEGQILVTLLNGQAICIEGEQ